MSILFHNTGKLPLLGLEQDINPFTFKEVLRVRNLPRIRQFGRFLDKFTFSKPGKGEFSVEKHSAISQLRGLQTIHGKRLHVIDFGNESLRNVLFCEHSDRIVVAMVLLSFVKKYQLTGIGKMKFSSVSKMHWRRRPSNAKLLPSEVSVFDITRDIHLGHMETPTNDQSSDNEFIAGALDLVSNALGQSIEEISRKLFSKKESIGSQWELRQDDLLTYEETLHSHERRTYSSMWGFGPRSSVLSNELLDYVIKLSNAVPDRVATIEPRKISATLVHLLSVQAINYTSELGWLIRCRRKTHRRMLIMEDATISYNPMDNIFLIRVRPDGLRLPLPHWPGTFSNIAASDVLCSLVRCVIELSRPIDDVHMLDELHDEKAKSALQGFNEEVFLLYDFVILCGVLREKRKIWVGGRLADHVHVATKLSSYETSTEREYSFEVKRRFIVYFNEHTVNKIKRYLSELGRMTNSALERKELDALFYHTNKEHRKLFMRRIEGPPPFFQFNADLDDILRRLSGQALEPNNLLTFPSIRPHADHHFESTLSKQYHTPFEFLF